MIRETPHCCRVSFGKAGEGDTVLSKRLSSSGNTGKDTDAGECIKGLVVSMFLGDGIKLLRGMTAGNTLLW